MPGATTLAVSHCGAGCTIGDIIGSTAIFVLGIQLAGLALCSATGLPLVVAIVGIGVERGGISTGVGASLIAAGMISVLLFPWLTATIVGPPEQPVAS